MRMSSARDEIDSTSAFLLTSSFMACHTTTPQTCTSTQASPKHAQGYKHHRAAVSQPTVAQVSEVRTAAYPVWACVSSPCQCTHTTHVDTHRAQLIGSNSESYPDTTPTVQQTASMVMHTPGTHVRTTRRSTWTDKSPGTHARRICRPSVQAQPAWLPPEKTW
jgi:hypothetical protein